MDGGTGRGGTEGGRSFSRRDFVSVGVGAFVVASVPWAIPERRRLFRRTAPVMGTLAEISVVGTDPDRARRAVDAALGELRFVDRTMSRFLEDSDVGRANRDALGRPVPISEATARVLDEGFRWAELSDGRFDPCLGAASELWNVERRRTPPESSRVRRFARKGLYRQVERVRHEGERAVRFHDADAAVDLGGIAKGHGVDRAVDALRRHGIRNALVSVGGDLFALGRSLEGDPWEVGVRSPRDPDRLVGTLEVSDRAMATSGDYERSFRYGGRRYHHLLDPETGEPRRTRIHSVTVSAVTCMAADAATTAVFGMDREQAGTLLAAGDPTAQLVHMG